MCRREFITDFSRLPVLPVCALPVLLYCSLRSVYRREFITDFSRVEGIPVRLPSLAPRVLCCALLCCAALCLPSAKAAVP